jgi:hypothetical protein
LAKIIERAGGMTVEPTRSDKLIIATGGAALGVLTGMIFAGPLGAGAGAAIGVVAQPAMEWVVAKCVPEFRRRGNVLAEAASRSSGLDQDEVVERLLESVELQTLVARVLDATAQTNSTEILTLLGGMLGASVADGPRKIDEDLMLVDGMRGLEPGHLRLLEILEQPADPSNPDVFWADQTIAAALGDSLSHAGRQVAIGGLLGRGLIQRMSGLDGGGYTITEFGSALLGALRRSTPS